MTPLNIERWRQALVSLSASVTDVIKNLDETGLQIALVVGDDGVLFGTVTDGDVRRGLLRGSTMSTRVDAIAFQTPLVVPNDAGRDAVLALMQANRIRQLPIVDGRRRVIGLHVLPDLLLPALRPNVMVVMAGGEGVRLRPETEHCPKPMLLVHGRPILELIFEQAMKEGFRHFVFAVRYLANVIEEHFADGKKWNAHIEYLREEKPLGTAGALTLLKEKATAPYLISNGDVLTDVRYGDLLDFHERHRAAATMAVRPFEWQHPFGVVQTEGVEFIKVDEKPIARHFVNAGVYVLDPAVIGHLEPDHRCDMPELFSRVRAGGERTIVFPLHESWLDVGRANDLQLARRRD